VITEALVRVWSAVTSWLLSLMPAWDAPVWITTATSWLADGLAEVDAFAWFLPVAAVRHAVLFLLVCMAVLWAVRGVRIVASFMTGGGGSAA
jgi:hypothetical protein